MSERYFDGLLSDKMSETRLVDHLLSEKSEGTSFDIEAGLMSQLSEGRNNFLQGIAGKAGELTLGGMLAKHGLENPAIIGLEVTARATQAKKMSEEIKPDDEIKKSDLQSKKEHKMDMLINYALRYNEAARLLKILESWK